MVFWPGRPVQDISYEETKRWKGLTAKERERLDQLNKADGMVIDKIAELLDKRGRATTRMISLSLGKENRAKLRKFGGLGTSLSRLSDLGIISWDKEHGWVID